MADPFMLPLEYKGEEKEFDCELRVMGYTYKIAVALQGAEVLFEPDEEGNFRAAVTDARLRKENWDVDLLAAIARQLEFHLKGSS